VSAIWLLLEVLAGVPVGLFVGWLMIVTSTTYH
jgi:hypothetical protein